ncbi:MAG: terminase large subunit domain-containing protein [Actinomycetota bacterium]
MAANALALDIASYADDPVGFIQDVLVDPETGEPFVLYRAQKRFMRRALKLKNGRLRYSELVYACPKKSGKTATAAMIVLFVTVVLGGPFAEGYVLANDEEQARSRVFTAISRIIEASPLLRPAARLMTNRIEFPSTGSFIQALSSDYASAAGANPTIVVFDELWAYVHERARRLWDEMVPVPTRAVSVRLTVTYGGFEGESELLEELYARGLKGTEIEEATHESPGMLMFWSHKPVAPWQTDDWLAMMRVTLRPTAYVRQIEVRFASSESTFVDMDWWDRCVDDSISPVLHDRALPVYVGADAGWKRDSTAIVACAYDSDAGKVRVVFHRIFYPSQVDELNFEATIESTLLDLDKRFDVREVRYDPTQLVATAQRLRRHRLNMVEFHPAGSTVPPGGSKASSNNSLMANNLYDCVKGNNLVTYPDAEVRLAVSRAVAKDTPSGWKITKDKAAHTIDVVVALAMASLGALWAQYEWKVPSFDSTRWGALNATLLKEPYAADVGSGYDYSPGGGPDVLGVDQW